MNLNVRRDWTVTGRPMLIVGGECGWNDFPQRALAVVRHFGMKVVSETDGSDARLWLTSIDHHQFCVSWDIWCLNVSIMPWASTPDDAIEDLFAAS